MLWSVTIITFLGACMALLSFLVPYIRVRRVRSFTLMALLVDLRPFPRISFLVTACLAAVSVLYQMVYTSILMREDIFLFGLSSHALAIEVVLCVFWILYFVGASTFFPAFYHGDRPATIASSAVCAACSLVMLVLACACSENTVAFEDVDGNTFDANLTPENEQIMLAFFQMFSFISFGHTLFMHALLWNLAYSRVATHNYLGLPTKTAAAK